MNSLFKLLKFLVILIFVLILVLYYFFDDLKRYSLKTAINVATENGKYLVQPYSINFKEGVLYLSNFEIKTPDIYLKINNSKIDVPFFFLFNNAIKLTLDNFTAKPGQGGDLAISGSAEIDLWYGGELYINTSGIDIAMDKKKILKFTGSVDNKSKLNVINIYDYMDSNNKGQMVFGVSNYTALNFQTIAIPYGGGIVVAEPFRIDIRDPKLKLLNLDINNMSLASILKLNVFEIDSRFSGKISVNPDEKKILSINLKTTGPGKLKFKSNKLIDFVDKIDQGPLGMALGLVGNNPLTAVHKAMNLFEFSSVQIETEKSDKGKDNIKISLYGLDQKLYDNRPLNINLDLDLNGIIKSYLGSCGK